MDLDLRISRWILEAQRRGVHLERILIHPNDYDRACRDFPFLPIRVLGQSQISARSPAPSAGPI